MDKVSQMYSGPLVQLQGSRQWGGGPFDTFRKFAIPIMHAIKDKLFTAAKGVAMAVRDAGSATLKHAVESLPQAAAEGVKKVVEKGTTKFIKKVLGKRKAAAEEVVQKSNKRSRLDELLGDDSY